MITLLQLQKQIEKFIAENPEAADLRVIHINRDDEYNLILGTMTIENKKLIELS